ncbi:Zn-dependent hydrolase [Rhizobium oryzicola]|uniref:Zn-dependent hydrolase n=1 Tax=Rhizobium oryzicola TaxID=1232668 RepID=A0ABT8SVN6_9HYPH|nr:Zn-dependent hydrolase [Rhizobium oryzicola]MDO1582505.1 Zn-dependent hydrolase [Rhizobium oryzicola]
MNAMIRTDRQKLQADFDALAALTEPGRPWTRRSFTPLFLKGREYLQRRFAEEGLDCRIDVAGNLIGRWEGNNPSLPVLMTGSHSDTVPSGGRFDGIAGILTGLAAISALRKAGIRPSHTIELVDFLAEEPSEWGLSCIGSRGMAAALEPHHFDLKGPNGEDLASAITRMGGKPEQIRQSRRTDIDRFVEIHIEQGPVLERSGMPIGVVTAIAGIARLRIRFEGEAGHAGTTPMDMRADAGLAAARLALALRDAARAVTGQGHFTATTGIMRFEPGGANVVPGAAELIVDIRAEQDAAMDTFLKTAEGLAGSAADAEGCRVASFERLSRTFAVACDEATRTLISTAASDMGLAAMPLASGAGHDAAFVAQIAPAAMIFVPSKGGRSHTPEEWTDLEAIALSADLLALTLLRLDTRKHT